MMFCNLIMERPS